MSKKQRILREFYRLFYNEGRREEAAQLLSADYLNHRGGEIMRGRAAAIVSFGAFAAGAPEFHIDIRRIAEDGDFVWAHSLVSGLPGAYAAAVVDIWRFDGDRIAEHWDVVQRIPQGGVIEKFV